MLYLTGQFKLSKLSIKENLILVGFSTLFTLNIAISNVSLYVPTAAAPRLTRIQG